MSYFKSDHQQETFNASLSRIRTRFAIELQAKVSRMEVLRTLLEKTPTDRRALDEIGHIAHKIAGTAATLGFPELGALATKAEDGIHQCNRTCSPPSQDVWTSVEDFYVRACEVAASAPVPDQND